jgi:hypothetical protein
MPFKLWKLLLQRFSRFVIPLLFIMEYFDNLHHLWYGEYYGNKTNEDFFETGYKNLVKKGD